MASRAGKINQGSNIVLAQHRIAIASHNSYPPIKANNNLNIANNMCA
jgi:hypothetical protein